MPKTAIMQGRFSGVAGVTESLPVAADVPEARNNFIHMSGARAALSAAFVFAEKVAPVFSVLMAVPARSRVGPLAIIGIFFLAHSVPRLD